MSAEFHSFPKIARLSREIIVTEKIDGTNAQILIDEEGNITAGSRTRMLVDGEDNYGFAKWVVSNKDELLKLGPGRHFGEWWGNGIQRGYGQAKKRFSLFNVSRWKADPPKCCDVVPTLYVGEFSLSAIDRTLTELALHGSHAAPGFMKPEGVVIFHTAANMMFKKTIEKDNQPKSTE